MVKIWKPLKYLLMNEWIKCGIYTQWNISSPRELGNPMICDNLDEA